MNKPEIIGIAQSSYVRTARMAAVEKQVDYDYSPDPPGSEAVNAIHPFGKVPVFRHGKLELFETRAITDYLDHAFDGPSLQPADPAAKARMEQWISAINDVVYDAMVRRYVLQYVFPANPDGTPDRGTIDKALEQVRHQLQVFDRALRPAAWLAGDTLSLADLFLLPILFYVEQMPEGKELFSPHRNLQRFTGSMAERRSFQATLPPAA